MRHSCPHLSMPVSHLKTFSPCSPGAASWWIFWLARKRFRGKHSIALPGWILINDCHFLAPVQLEAFFNAVFPIRASSIVVSIFVFAARCFVATRVLAPSIDIVFFIIVIIVKVAGLLVKAVYGDQRKLSEARFVDQEKSVDSQAQIWRQALKFERVELVA